LKTRNGFVSNSSSSSFIVLLPNKPKNVSDLKRMMFPRYKSSEKIEEMTIKDIVGRVFKDIERSERKNDYLELLNSGYFSKVDYCDYSISKMLKDRRYELFKESYKIISELETKCPTKAPISYNFNKATEYRNKIWSKKEPDLYKKYVKIESDISKLEEEYFSKRKEEIKELYDEWKSTYKHHKFEFSVEYGDRNGEATLEHKTIFRNVPHLTASHH